MRWNKNIGELIDAHAKLVMGDETASGADHETLKIYSRTWQIPEEKVVEILLKDMIKEINEYYSKEDRMKYKGLEQWEDIKARMEAIGIEF